VLREYGQLGKFSLRTRRKEERIVTENGRKIRVLKLRFYGNQVLYACIEKEIFGV
jgi:hypothetical protein